jgi:hypothetical protein
VVPGIAAALAPPRGHHRLSWQEDEQACAQIIHICPPQPTNAESALSEQNGGYLKSVCQKCW